jgi:hypothetical protein
MSHLNRAQPAPCCANQALGIPEIHLRVAGLQRANQWHRAIAVTADITIPTMTTIMITDMVIRTTTMTRPVTVAEHLILTERGEVRIEDLAIGDMVVTISDAAFDGGLSDEEVETH